MDGSYQEQTARAGGACSDKLGGFWRKAGQGDQAPTAWGAGAWGTGSDSEASRTPREGGSLHTDAVGLSLAKATLWKGGQRSPKVVQKRPSWKEGSEELVQSLVREIVFLMLGKWSRHGKNDNFLFWVSMTYVPGHTTNEFYPPAFSWWEGVRPRWQLRLGPDSVTFRSRVQDQRCALETTQRAAGFYPEQLAGTWSFLLVSFLSLPELLVGGVGGWLVGGHGGSTLGGAGRCGTTHRVPGPDTHPHRDSVSVNDPG